MGWVYHQDTARSGYLGNEGLLLTFPDLFPLLHTAEHFTGSGPELGLVLILNAVALPLTAGAATLGLMVPAEGDGPQDPQREADRDQQAPPKEPDD